MHILFGTEIWGRTSHVDVMVQALEEIAVSVTVVDPYDGTDQKFTSEEEAYAAFTECGGHDAYAVRMSQALMKSEHPVYLLGFSAGAGAVWSAAGNVSTDAAKGAWCFYSSSIHTMMEHEPAIPVEIIFPDSEPNFDVETVARDLQDKPNVQCYITPFAHGFLNPEYDHFDKEVFGFWLQWIKDQLQAATQQA